MFETSRQFGFALALRRKFLPSSYKYWKCNEHPKYLSMYNYNLLETDYSEGTNKIENVKKRWISTHKSDGLSYRKHEVTSPLLEMTAGQLLEKAAEQWPDRDCIVSSHQRMRFTYAEILRRSDKLAAGLIKLGLKRGDRVGVWGPNDVEWLVSFLGIARAGCIMVGINSAYQQSEIDYCLQKIDARAVIAPKTFKTQHYSDMLVKSKKTCRNLDHIIIYSDDHVSGTRRFADVESLANRIEVQAIAAMQGEISSYEPCNIQFTSGTTGKPKAVLLSHRSFVNNSRQGAKRLGLMNDHQHNKICLNVPFFHAFGMVMGQFATLHSGSTIVLESRSFNPKQSVEAIIREKCTVNYGTPTMWINMMDAREKLNAPINTLQYGVTGGATISPEVMKRIKEQLRFQGIQNIYGLTETTAIIFQSLPGESPELTDNTVGFLSDNLEVMVVDSNENPVPIGTPGELWVRGYSTMMKYWDDEESTKKSMNESGWLKTGDQIILRSDGYGRVMGRLKDMMIRGGENIYPKEIEDFLETHPDVLEAHVVGVYDEVYGEEVCACVRISETSKLTPNDLRTYGKGKIAHFKIPRYIKFVDSYPRTASGKIKKFEMRKELENQGFVPSTPINN